MRLGQNLLVLIKKKTRVVTFKLEVNSFMHETDARRNKLRVVLSSKERFPQTKHEMACFRFS